MHEYPLGSPWPIRHPPWALFGVDLRRCRSVVHRVLVQTLYADNGPLLLRVKGFLMRRDLLAEDDLDRIHAQGLRILEEVGTEVHSPTMLEQLDGAGQRIEGTRVFWDSDFVMSQLTTVPETTSLTGRNPERAVKIGGGSLVHTP